MRPDPAVPGGEVARQTGERDPGGRGVCRSGLGQRYLDLCAIEKAPDLIDECRGDAANQRNKALRFPSGAV